MLKKYAIWLAATAVVLVVGFVAGKTSSEWGKAGVVWGGLLVLFIFAFQADVKLSAKRRSASKPFAGSTVAAIVRTLEVLLGGIGSILLLGLLMEFGLISRWVFGALSAYIVCIAMTWASVRRPNGTKQSQMLVSVTLDALRLYAALAFVMSLMFGLMYLVKKHLG